MIRVFVDGGSGTTGLRIGERLAARGDVERIMLSEERRKDPAARKEALNSCDAAFLCLPDAAAREAVAMVENKDVVILDASTAHRTQPGWAYGFAELSSAHRQAIATGKRIAVPGCHASGFIALVYPLVACGLLEAAKYVGTAEAAEYTKLAAQMLGSVAAHYAVKEGPQGIGLVRHGTYSKKSPYNTCTPEGVDECVSWGDYFYMEALTRLTKDWELYW